MVVKPDGACLKQNPMSPVLVHLARFFPNRGNTLTRIASVVLLNLVVGILRRSQALGSKFLFGGE